MRAYDPKTGAGGQGQCLGLTLPPPSSGLGCFLLWRLPGYLPMPVPTLSMGLRALPVHLPPPSANLTLPLPMCWSWVWAKSLSFFFPSMYIPFIEGKNWREEANNTSFGLFNLLKNT